MNQKKEISDNQGDFTLSEALISTTTIKKLQSDVAKLKHIMSEVHQFVMQHQVKINNSLVDEVKLQVTVEMFKKDVEKKQQIEMHLFQGRVDNSLETRPLMVDVEERLRNKVEHKEFNRSLEKINENFKLFESRVLHQLSVQKVDFQKMLDRKAESREIEILKKNKADKEDMAAMSERMDQLETMAKQAMEESDSEDEDSEKDDYTSIQDAMEVKAGRPQPKQGINAQEESLEAGRFLVIANPAVMQTQQSKKIQGKTKGSEAMKIIDFKDQSNKTAKSLKQQVNVKIPKASLEDDQVRIVESQSDLSRFMTTGHGHQGDTIFTQGRNTLEPPSIMTMKSKKQASDGSSSSKNPFKKKTANKIDKMNNYMNQMFEDITKRMNENRAMILDLVDQTAMLVSTNQQNSSLVTKHENDIEGELKIEIQKMTKEIERLLRIDVKLNKELVVKPYNYIDKIKETLEKDWVETKKKLSDQNDKYMGKFISLESSVSKLIVDTSSLVDQYKKKIGDIGKDLTATKVIRDGIEIKLTSQNQALSHISERYQKDLDQVKKDVDGMKERLRSELANLKEENHGFLRELQRNQLITRELQQEFMMILNEKKKVHEDLIQQVISKQNNISGSSTQDQSLTGLLPQLKAQTITNQESLSRQIKLGKLFSEKKSVDYSTQVNNTLISQAKKGLVNQLTLPEENLRVSALGREKYKTPQKERVPQTQRREKSDTGRFDEELSKAKRAQQRSFILNEQSQDKSNTDQMAQDDESVNTIIGDQSNDFTRLHRMYGEQLH